MPDPLNRPEGWALELKRIARAGVHDEQATPELDPEALDFRAGSGSFAPARRLQGG